MKRPWLIALPLLAGLWWAARRGGEAWRDDLELALGRGRSVVVLVAAQDRPLASAARAAVDQAWGELHPGAERVALERFTPRLGRETALALFVFSPGGELVARRDGPLDARSASEWLREALAAASSAEQRAQDARGDPQLLFDHAQRALRLGDVDRAQREFEELAEQRDPELGARAHERLARLELERGAVALAREHLSLAVEGRSTPAARAEMLFTRGLLELAQRENRAACATLRAAVDAFEASRDPEALRATFELARAQAACGEESLAIATLEQLARAKTPYSLRESARRFADELRAPPVSQ